MLKQTFPDCCCQCPIPVVSPCSSLQHQQVVLIQSAVGSLLFSSGSWCTQDLVCALQDWSLYFPQSCGSLIIKSQCLSRSEFQGFPVPLSDPQVGSLTRDFEPLQQWANFFGIIVLQLVGHLPAGMRLDFIVIVSLLPSHCGFSFVFGCGVSFFSGFQNLPIDGYSTASAILVLLQEEMSTLSSNLPSPV